MSPYQKDKKFRSLLLRLLGIRKHRFSGSLVALLGNILMMVMVKADRVLHNIQQCCTKLHNISWYHTKLKNMKRFQLQGAQWKTAQGWWRAGGTKGYQCLTKRNPCRDIIYLLIHWYVIRQEHTSSICALWALQYLYVDKLTCYYFEISISW